MASFRVVPHVGRFCVGGAVRTTSAVSAALRVPHGLDQRQQLRWKSIPANYDTSKHVQMIDDPALTELNREFVAPADMYQSLGDNGIDFYAGVPDSLLKDFCAYVTENSPPENHIICANEGAAVATAAGHYMATKKIPCVYLQNSGLGNIINPIMSLAHEKVYSIPMLFIIGWRGEPGKKDEPQHVVQGDATPAMLTSMEIPFQVLPDFIEGVDKVLKTARKTMQVTKGPYALLVKRQTFEKYSMPKPEPSPLPMNREEALKTLLPLFDDRDILVGTTGMLSRELFEARVALGQTHERDFLTVGSMGHASSIALGIHLARPRRTIYCLDGDGAAIMHLGAWTTNATYGGENFRHILINNAAHDSVGGQPTAAAMNNNLDFVAMADAAGYKKAISVSTPEEVAEAMAELSSVPGPTLLEIKVRPGGHRPDLGRPTTTPIQNKKAFMKFVRSNRTPGRNLE